MTRRRPHPVGWAEAHAILAAVLIALMLTAVTGPNSYAQSTVTPDACIRAVAGAHDRSGTPDPFSETSARRRESVAQAASNIVSCLNAKNWEATTLLVSGDYLKSAYGAETPEQAIETMQKLDRSGYMGRIELLSVEETELNGSSSAFALVTWRQGAAIHRERWKFEETSSGWYLMQAVTQSPPVLGPAVGLVIHIESDQITATRSEVFNPGTVVLDLVNVRDTPESIAVFSLSFTSSSEEVEELVERAQLDMATPVAALEIPALERIALPLVELPEGSYALVAGFEPAIDVNDVSPSRIWVLQIRNP
jgi:hypothetical protein